MNFEEELQEKLKDLGRQVQPSCSMTAEVMRRINAVGQSQPWLSRLPEAEGPRFGGDCGKRCLWSALRRLWRPVASAAAAAVVLGIIAWVAWPGSAGVAWADVVGAMNRVPQFHATILWEDGGDLIRTEAFYRAPNLWRGEGLGRIQFVRGEEVRVFDAATHEPVEVGDGTTTPLPSGIARALSPKDSLLAAILRSLFPDGAPKAAPVRLEVKGATDDLEVFDYGTHPVDPLVRVWVLRKTRLPIRVRLEDKVHGRSLVVLFDYCDPKPEEFFDARQFEAAGMAKSAPATLKDNEGTLANGSALGPVVARIVRFHPGRRGVADRTNNTFIDFDTGKLMTPPTGVLVDVSNKHSRRFRWTKSGGADATVVDPRYPRVVLYDMACVAVKADAWDSLTPAEIVRRLKAESHMFDTNVAGPFPKTFVVRTRQMGVGILQLLGPADDGQGFKVRFKMVVAKARKGSVKTP